MQKSEIVTMFDFLDNVRVRGFTNMFGASPVLGEAFDLEPRKARKVLITWMNTYSDTKTIDQRAQDATEFL